MSASGNTVTEVGINPPDLHKYTLDSDLDTSTEELTGPTFETTRSYGENLAPSDDEELDNKDVQSEEESRASDKGPVGARYSATALTWGDASPVRFGMIRVRDVAAGVPDLLSAQRLDSATHAIGGIQERGDPGATPPGERLASANRTPSADLGRPRPHQRAGPATAQGTSPGPVRHSWHTLAMAHQLDQTTMDRQAPEVRAHPPHRHCAG